MRGKSANHRRKKAEQRGIAAEYLAAVYLWMRGYKILALRYKSPVGEIDIIARKKNVLVMVEVKMRSRIEDALEAVHHRNRGRVAAAARHYLTYVGMTTDCALRFDVIALGWPFRLRHLNNAWQA